jgi:hypothetical protein
MNTGEGMALLLLSKKQLGAQSEGTDHVLIIPLLR